VESTKQDIEPGLKVPVPGEAVRPGYLALMGIIYLIAFAATELITYYFEGYAGIICYFAILLSLIFNSAVDKNEAQRKLWLSLGLVPLIRIVSLAIPLPEISVIFWYLIIAVPVLAGIYTVSRASRYDINDIGLNGNKPLVQILVAISGLALGLADYWILKPEALNSHLTFQATLVPALILIIASGLAEELAFRGVMQRAAVTLNSRGWIYIALMYAVLQIGQGSILHGVFIFGVGLYYGWIVKKTGSVLGAAFSHGLLNIALYLILPHLF
jgi:uncharacterized protein